MTTEIVVTLAPTRDVEIVLFDEWGTTLDIGTPAQVAEIVLSEVFRGLKGDLGDPGPSGPAGPAGGTSYVFSQGSASALWTIDHGLNRYPSVTVIDSTGREVEGDVEYVSSNRVTVGFAFPFAGQAFLN